MMLDLCAAEGRGGAKLRPGLHAHELWPCVNTSVCFPAVLWNLRSMITGPPKGRAGKGQVVQAGDSFAKVCSTADVLLKSSLQKRV